jgi:2'-5' RNA ligase
LKPGLEIERYFLAIVPPDAIASRVRQWQLELAEKYSAKASLRSPPHITLHMPFIWKSKRGDELREGLKTYCRTTAPFTVTLEGVGAFPPSVIFVNVKATEELMLCQRNLGSFCRMNFNIHNAEYGDLPYHPHLTLAFRDLRKNDFPAAWQDFHHREFKESFTTSSICLLRHTGTEWAVFNEMALGQSK